MSELKKGDVVEIIGKHTKYMLTAKSGCRYVVSENVNDKIVRVGCTLHLEKKDIKKVKEFKMDYETSNRKKLHNYIKASGYTSSKLGEVIDNKWHFSNITKKSRFDKFGDISEKSLIDSKFLVESIITGLNKEPKASNELSSDNDYITDGLNEMLNAVEFRAEQENLYNDRVNAILAEKQLEGINETKYSNFIKLQKLAFAMCFIIVILLISILYFVVSK